MKENRAMKNSLVKVSLSIFTIFLLTFVSTGASTLLLGFHEPSSLWTTIFSGLEVSANIEVAIFRISIVLMTVFFVCVLHKYTR